MTRQADIVPRDIPLLWFQPISPIFFNRTWSFPVELGRDIAETLNQKLPNQNTYTLGMAAVRIGLGVPVSILPSIFFWEYGSVSKYGTPYIGLYVCIYSIYTYKYVCIYTYMIVYTHIIMYVYIYVFVCIY